MDARALAGIDARQLDPAEALRLEPNVNPALIESIQVPDGTVDPFRLAAANVLDAKEHGARIFTHSKVLGLLHPRQSARGQGDQHPHRRSVRGGVPGGDQRRRHLGPADLRVRRSRHPHVPGQGLLLIMDYRINQLVLNRARKPADADILVPGDTISSSAPPRVASITTRLTSSPSSLKRWKCCCAKDKTGPTRGPHPIAARLCRVRPLAAVDGDVSPAATSAVA